MSGTIKGCMWVKIAPGIQKYQVHLLEMQHEDLCEGVPDDYIGIRLANADINDLKVIKRRKGYVLQNYDKVETKAEKFLARIMVINHPTKIKAGYTPVIHCHSSQIPCKFS